ncbi:MAG: hypothetical protein MSB10_06300 [Clostridiales bacterium]|uniref:hypothetical protein n=1 Tax=Flavonifractor porci TaxID=3133422 RepID=UPI0030B034C1|nr:hypothetical protein [Clostridiales bacterium]
MNKKTVLAGALALCMTLSACGSKTPSLEEVEAAIRDGSVTVEDALDKGWVDQAWVDNYMEENSVPAADKIAINMVGEFETETVTGEAFTNTDLSSVTFMAFLDPEDGGAAGYYEELVKAVENVRGAGADIVLCTKGGMDDQLYQDAPFPVVAYNDSMQEALAQNDEMASGIPCTGVWYVDGSLVSAWLSTADADSLAESAKSFVDMKEEPQESGDGSMTAMPMG